MEEHKKVIEEIKVRKGSIDTWFYSRFVLLGGLFFVLTHLRSNTQELSKNHQLRKFLNCHAVHLVLGVGCVIAVMVDMHIRHELDAIMILGHWLAHYLEPALSGMDFKAKNEGQFLFWENLLRAENTIGPKPVLSPLGYLLGVKDNGTILDLFLLHSMPHVFFITLVLYIPYVWTFHNILFGHSIKQAGTAVIGTFLMVHGTFLAFGVLASKANYYPFWFALALLGINILCGLLFRMRVYTDSTPAQRDSISDSDRPPHLEQRKEVL